MEKESKYIQMVQTTKQPSFPFIQWIGLRENLQESPIFNGKIYGFL